MTWCQAVVFAGYSGFLHYIQLSSHELATIGITVTKNKNSKPKSFDKKKKENKTSVQKSRLGQECNLISKTQYNQHIVNIFTLEMPTASSSTQCTIMTGNSHIEHLKVTKYNF